MDGPQHKITDAKKKPHGKTSINFRYSEKAKKNLSNIPPCLDITKQFKKRWDILSNFVVFS